MDAVAKTHVIKFVKPMSNHGYGNAKDSLLVRDLMQLITVGDATNQMQIQTTASIDKVGDNLWTIACAMNEEQRNKT
jgi:hypothetical protein